MDVSLQTVKVHRILSLYMVAECAYTEFHLCDLTNQNVNQDVLLR